MAFVMLGYKRNSSKAKRTNQRSGGGVMTMQKEEITTRALIRFCEVLDSTRLRRLARVNLKAMVG
jgi:hypothetical protein